MALSRNRSPLRNWNIVSLTLLDPKLRNAPGLGTGPPVVSAGLDHQTSVAPASVSRPVPGSRGAPALVRVAASIPLSHLQDGDHWHLLSAKPMLVPAAGLDFTPVPKCSAYSSTPQHESWSVALGKRACKTSPQTSCELQLSNRYDLLSIDDFPPLPAVSELGATPGRATSLVVPSLWLAVPSRWLQLVFPPQRLQRLSLSLLP